MVLQPEHAYREEVKVKVGEEFYETVCMGIIPCGVQLFTEKGSGRLFKKHIREEHYSFY